jgi:hypothetical protein
MKRIDGRVRTVREQFSAPIIAAEPYSKNERGTPDWRMIDRRVPRRNSL